MDRNITNDSIVIDLSNMSISDTERQLRLSLYRTIYRRLETFFEKRNVKITRDTQLKSILRPDSIQTDWEKLNSIGLKMPMLRMPKFLTYIIAFYIACVCILLLTLATRYFQFIVIVSDLPIIGIVTTVTAVTILYFVFMFKRNRLPCDTIDELIEFIISIHWTDLIKDDNRQLKEIIGDENSLS